MSVPASVPSCRLFPLPEMFSLAWSAWKTRVSTVPWLRHGPDILSLVSNWPVALVTHGMASSHTPLWPHLDFEMLDMYWDVFEPENVLFHWSHPALNTTEGWVAIAPCHWLVAHEGEAITAMPEPSEQKCWVWSGRQWYIHVPTPEEQ